MFPKIIILDQTATNLLVLLALTQNQYYLVLPPKVYHNITGTLDLMNVTLNKSLNVIKSEDYQTLKTFYNIVEAFHKSLVEEGAIYRFDYLALITTCEELNNLIEEIHKMIDKYQKPSSRYLHA